jgi:pyrroloquinoline quinone (PQQ) biosynthesis protein C
MNARINWEVSWGQVPAQDKAKLFEVVSTSDRQAIDHELTRDGQARDQHPFLAKFERDWATEEIVKQFVKNKRKNHYAHGWLEVPAKYAYLKQNAMKRNRTASRSKRAMKTVDSRPNAEPGPSL